MSSISVEALRKQYGDNVAVDGISFAAEPGQVFGLLGPNGAGKTTTIGCISGLLQPTAGRVADMGHDGDGVMRRDGGRGGASHGKHRRSGRARKSKDR